MLVADLSVALGQDPQGGGRAALGTGLAGRQTLRTALGSANVPFLTLGSYISLWRRDGPDSPPWKGRVCTTSAHTEGGFPALHEELEEQRQRKNSSWGVWWERQRELLLGGDTKTWSGRAGGKRGGRTPGQPWLCKRSGHPRSRGEASTAREEVQSPLPAFLSGPRAVKGLSTCLPTPQTSGNHHCLPPHRCWSYWATEPKARPNPCLSDASGVADGHADHFLPWKELQGDPFNEDWEGRASSRPGQECLGEVAPRDTSLGQAECPAGWDPSCAPTNHRTTSSQVISWYQPPPSATQLPIPSRHDQPKLL